jgi:hypothetical protein
MKPIPTRSFAAGRSPAFRAPLRTSAGAVSPAATSREELLRKFLRVVRGVMLANWQKQISSQNLVDNVSVDVGQAEVSALEGIRQTQMIDSQEVVRTGLENHLDVLLIGLHDLVTFL